MAIKKIFLTHGTTSFLVPGDWNSATNSVETLAAGAGASPGFYDGGGNGTASDYGGYGGGAGAYSKKTNLTLTPGNSVTVSIGAGSIGGSGTDGGDTSFGASTVLGSTVGAKGGKYGSSDNAKNLGTPAPGGDASSGVGDTKYSGGNGGDQANHDGGGGGGGAAGPHGAGSNGAQAGAGGAADNATVAGGTANHAGSQGTEFDISHGCGSGGGGNAQNNSQFQDGTAAGGYGGGGGAGGKSGTPGNGGDGLIIITYTARTIQLNIGVTG